MCAAQPCPTLDIFYDRVSLKSLAYPRETVRLSSFAPSTRMYFLFLRRCLQATQMVHTRTNNTSSKLTVWVSLLFACAAGIRAAPSFDHSSTTEKAGDYKKNNSVLKAVDHMASTFSSVCADKTAPHKGCRVKPGHPIFLGRFSTWITKDGSLTDRSARMSCGFLSKETLDSGPRHASFWLPYR